MTDLQPRTVAGAPRGVWLLASAVREEPIPVGARYPHICGIEIDKDRSWWARDCVACWHAGWRPRTWEAAVERARLAAAAALLDPRLDPGSAPPPAKTEEP